MKKTPETQSVPERDYQMTGEEANEMQARSIYIKNNLEAWRKQGYDIKLEPTSKPGLYKVTITDPKTKEIVFYEDEELMERISKKEESKEN